MGIKSTLSPLQITSTKSPEVANLNANLIDMLKPVLVKEILDGSLLRDIELDSAATNHVPHKLGRALIGYIVLKKDVNATVWDSEASNTRKALFLDLECSSDCTVSLWIF